MVANAEDGVAELGECEGVLTDGKQNIPSD